MQCMDHSTKLILTVASRTTSGPIAAPMAWSWARCQRGTSPWKSSASLSGPMFQGCGNV